MDKERFLLLDWHEDRLTVGKFETIEEANKAARTWDEVDTDGECDLALYRREKPGSKYQRLPKWKY